MFKHKLAFVVPTKDRPEELRRLLRSLEAQSAPPDEVIVVDGSDRPVPGILDGFPGLAVRRIPGRPPSATRQRNLGIRAVGPKSTLIGIIDDDTILKPDACEAMLAFWENAGETVGGAAFNLVNHPPLFASAMKHIPVVERLGLYSRRPGTVLPSGFQVMLDGLTADRPVEWLSAMASVWRRRIFEEFVFDEWYDGYSYLEDLDFSYRVGKAYGLYVVASAGVYHYPSARGRLGGFRFGRREVANRLHFVRKHRELSLPKCYLALSVRAGLSLILALREFDATYFRRAVGNIVEMAKFRE